MLIARMNAALNGGLATEKSAHHDYLLKPDPGSATNVTNGVGPGGHEGCQQHPTRAVLDTIRPVEACSAVASHAQLIVWHNHVWQWCRNVPDGMNAGVQRLDWLLSWTF